MKIILILSLLIASITAHAQTNAHGLAVTTNQVLTGQATNFFTANSNLLNAAVSASGSTATLTATNDTRPLKLTNSLNQFAGTFTGNAGSLSNLNATNLSGTLQTAQFPATLPAASGANLTSIPESAVTSLTSDLAAKAPLASPTFTGTATAGTFAGSAASLTTIPAAQLTGTQANGTESTNTAKLTGNNSFSGVITATNLNSIGFPVLAYIMTNAPVTITAATDTSILGTGVGSLTIPANTLKLGSVVYLYWQGVITNTPGSITATNKMLVNGVPVLIGVSSSMGISASGSVIDPHSKGCAFKVTKPGASGTASLCINAESAGLTFLTKSTNGFAIDTTANLTFDLQWAFTTAAAGRVLTVENATLEVVNPF